MSGRLTVVSGSDSQDVNSIEGKLDFGSFFFFNYNGNVGSKKMSLSI